MFIKADNTKADLTPTYMTGTAGGHSWTVTHDAVLRDGKPCVMKMGEIHFSRVPQKDWERELTKMKKGGIDIAASYVFWNHHENTEGKFDFTATSASSPTPAKKSECPSSSESAPGLTAKPATAASPTG